MSLAAAPDVKFLDDAVEQRKVEFASAKILRLKSDPYGGHVTLRRRTGKGLLRIRIRPGTVIRKFSNSVVVAEADIVELQGDRGAEGTVALKLYHLGLQPWQMSHVRDEEGHLEPRSPLLEALCKSERFLEADDNVRQAAVWMTQFASGQDIIQRAGGLYERYRRTCQSGTILQLGFTPFEISREQWDEGYEVVEPELIRAGLLVGRRTPRNATPRETSGSERGAPKETPPTTSKPSVEDARTKPTENESTSPPDQVLDIREAHATQVVRFEITFPEPSTRPYFAEWSLVPATRWKGSARIEVRPGTVVDQAGELAVLIDGFAVELEGEQHGTTRAYMLKMPRQGISKAYRGVPEPNAREDLADRCELRQLQDAKDPVRQATIWILMGGGVNYAGYKRFYDTKFTDSHGQIVTRENPYAITRSQWTTATSLSKLSTEGIRRRRAELRARYAAESEADNRKKSERKRAQREERERLADRKARTVEMNFARAVKRGLIDASIDSVALAPLPTELTLSPTAKLGDTILKLSLQPGTVVADAGDGSIVGYLAPGKALLEVRDGPVTLSLLCVLADLDRSGPGEYRLEVADAFANRLLRFGRPIEFRKQESNAPQTDRLTLGAGAIQSQVVALVHAHPDRSVEQWQAEFTRRGISDLFARMGAVERAPGVPFESGDVLALLHKKIETIDRDSASIATSDGRVFSESDLVGRWRVASPKRAVRVLGPIPIRRNRTGGDETTGRSRNERKYDWLPGAEAMVHLRHGYRFDLTLRANGSFTASFDSYIPNRENTGSGEWTWDGNRLRLHPPAYEVDHPEVLSSTYWHRLWTRELRMHKGMLLARIDVSGERKTRFFDNVSRLQNSGWTAQPWSSVVLQSR